MLKMIEAILAKRIVTESVKTTGDRRMRGQLKNMHGKNYACCGACVNACPVKAITLFDGAPEIDYKKCIFCGSQLTGDVCKWCGFSAVGKQQLSGTLPWHICKWLYNRGCGRYEDL